MQVDKVSLPRTLRELFHMLEQGNGRLIAGGTDVIPQMRSGRFQAEELISLNGLEDLHFIEKRDGVIAIGCLTTFNEIAVSSLLTEESPALVQAASMIGSKQTRNRCTIGGNIANASPAGDSLPPLLVMNAEVTLASHEGERKIPLSSLLQGPGRTSITPDEVIHHVSFSCLEQGTKSCFLRLGTRGGMAVSVASTALVLRLDQDGRVEDVRIALGAVAPTAIRCHSTEQSLMDQLLSEDIIDAAGFQAAEECMPITDIRGTASYRRHVVKGLVRRGLMTFTAKSR